MTLIVSDAMYANRRVFRVAHFAVKRQKDPALETADLISARQYIFLRTDLGHSAQIV